MEDYFKNVECAVTVCDTECVIVYQNEKSVAVNGDMRGRCMLGCHNDRSRGIIARILTEGITNSYTISKKGRRLRQDCCRHHRAFHRHPRADAPLRPRVRHNRIFQHRNNLRAGAEKDRFLKDLTGRYELNKNLAQMLKGGVIMDVTTPEQAKIAEQAGAAAVMALERIPADIRAAGGVSRMSDPKMIRGIQNAVSIPVMAKVRIGHFVEAQILQALEIDYIDESEVLSPADGVYHIDKTKFRVPFVCGAKNLGEALRRIAEGASMIRTKGEPGTGDVIQAVTHMRSMMRDIRRLQALPEDELYNEAKELEVPYDLVKYVHENGKLPVVNFAAGGVATPADAALMMQLGAEGVFVGSGIFKSGNPEKRAKAIVNAVTNYNDAALLAEVSTDLGEAMVGINEEEITILMAERGK